MDITTASGVGPAAGSQTSHSNTTAQLCGVGSNLFLFVDSRLGMGTASFERQKVRLT